MALWVCENCGTRFAVGLSMCPQCTSEQAHEYGTRPEEQEDVDMPKITVHGGASGATTEGGEPSSAGNSSETSTETLPTSDATSSPADQSPAPTTENPSSQDQTASSTAPSTGTGPAEQVEGQAAEMAPYTEWTNEALKDEIGRRNEAREAAGLDRLPVSGTKAELVERLEDDDTDPNRTEPLELEPPSDD